MAAIRVLLVDDEETVVDVLRTLIGTDPSLELVGAARDAEGGIQLALERQPDVVLMDVRMPGGGGVRAVREISRRCPHTGVVALSAHEDDDTRIRMIGAGARAYVPKSESTDAILAAIHRTAPTSGPPGRRRRRGRSGGAPGRRAEQRSRVERAIETGSVAATFRPVTDLVTGAVVGMEAQPHVAMLPQRPFDAWVGEAEGVDLAADLELAAVRRTLAALPSLPEELFVAFEVSPGTVGDARLRRAIKTPAASRLVLSISELALPTGSSLESLSALRSRGVRLAVRDAGTDLAGLARLEDVTPDFVRLDRGLTDGIEHDSVRHAVVAAVAAWAQDTGVIVIAGHVSGDAQADELRSLGVSLAQTEIGPPLHFADLVAGGRSTA
jgi:EAL domain-containing protein (putative c-di-GMP-specific phosphodiesterase class I)/CheY-like chemotaxis protein